MARRGQATAETVGLALLAAALLGLAGAGLVAGAPGVARALAAALPGHRAAVRGDRWALLDDRYGPLARRYAPVLVLESDRYGEDASVPVDVATCRAPACAAVGVGRPTAYVHVHRRDGATYLQYWLYYPGSLTDHLPVPALRGAHDDDWEGVVVRVADDGTAAVRATAHAGFAGARPWWDAASGWAAIDGPPVVYRAAGSHANGLGRDDVDLAGDRWNGDLAVLGPGALALLPADEVAGARRRYDPGATPPWRKAAWRDEDVPGTGEDGGRGRAAAAAAAWARAVALARPGDGGGEHAGDG